MRSGDDQSTWWPPRPAPMETVAGAAAGAFARSAALTLRPAVHAGMRSLFAGDDTRTEDAPPGDAGWFGPGSVTWKVHADASIFVGGIAALAFQALHPLAMAGVADHSNFTEDPIGRLRRTAEFVGATTYGTSEDASRACAAVQRLHGRVTGFTPDGRPYAADDPALLDWVHVTEHAAFAAAHRRYGAEPIGDDGLDTYVDEVARVAVELGVPDPPQTWTELDAHLEGHRPVLAIGAQAREAMRFLESPPLPAPILAVWPLLFRGAQACLPPWARELWGWSRPTPAERAACRVTVRSLGALLGPSPGLAAATERAEAHASDRPAA